MLNETEREDAEHRLAMLELMVAGLERHHEVAEAVWEARDVDDAAQRLRVLFGVEDETLPAALLALQFGRLTIDRRHKLAQDVEELRQLLGRP